MGARGKGRAAFEPALPRTSLSQHSRSQGRIFHGLPDRSIGQLRVSFGQATAGLEKSLPSPRFLLGRSLGCNSGFEGRLDDSPWPGFTAFQGHDSVSPVQPPGFHPAVARAARGSRAGPGQCAGAGPDRSCHPSAPCPKLRYGFPECSAPNPDWFPLPLYGIPHPLRLATKALVPQRSKNLL